MALRPLRGGYGHGYRILGVKLKRKGARRAIPIRGAYYHASDVYEAFPDSTLRPGTVYQVVVDDPTARRVDGHVLWSCRTAD